MISASRTSTASQATSPGTCFCADATHLLPSVESLRKQVSTRCHLLGLGSHDIEDVAQSAFALLIERAPKLGSACEVDRWLVVTTLRLALDERRRSGRWGSSAISIDAASHDPELVVSDEDPQELCERAEAFDLALQRIRRAPPPLREILLLRISYSWTRRQIVAWLRSWRPISVHEAERLVDKAHDWFLRTGRPQLRENPWISIPPPPVRSLNEWGQRSGAATRRSGAPSGTLAPEFPITHHRTPEARHEVLPRDGHDLDPPTLRLRKRRSLPLSLLSPTSGGHDSWDAACRVSAGHPAPSSDPWPSAPPGFRPVRAVSEPQHVMQDDSWHHLGLQDEQPPAIQSNLQWVR